MGSQEMRIGLLLKYIQSHTDKWEFDTNRRTRPKLYHGTEITGVK